MTAYLIIDTQVFRILKDQISVGRSLENDIVIQEDTISRMHAFFQKGEDGRYFVQDNNSTGGVYLNGQRIDRAVLRSGDSIVLASTAVVFVQNAPQLEKRSEVDTGQLNAPTPDTHPTIRENQPIWRPSPDDDQN